MAVLSPHRLRRAKTDFLAWNLVVGYIAAQLFLSTCAPALGQEVQAPEYRVKAAFLYNFTKLTEWPANAFADDRSPLIIGVLGRDPFGQELDSTIQGRLVKGRQLKVSRMSAAAEATNCHVLFICDSEHARRDSILDTLRGRPILTVADMNGFEARGMIAMIKSKDSISLRINLEATTRAGLRLSSRLTRLDRSLKPAPEAPPASPPNRK